MSTYKEMEVSVQKLAGTYLKDIIQIFTCNVESVNIQARTCDCTPIGGESSADLPNVSLCAESDNGLVVFPAVGSTVIVAVSARGLAFVLMYSAISSVQFMDGSYGGMVKLLDPNDSTAGVLARLNNLENLLNNLISLYNTHIHSTPSGPSSPTTSTETSTASVTTRAQLENVKIIQGA